MNLVNAIFMHTTNSKQRMEQFKAVEKEMKTKAYSKEGLSQVGKQDPKEREREELGDYLSEQLDEIADFLMTQEREEETLQLAVKKNKRDTSKADRLADIQTINERYKWHESKLQLLLRSLRNGSVDTEPIISIKEDIETVIKEAREIDFEAEAYEGLYDDFDLESEEAQFGLNNELDKMSSQDTQSVPDDHDPEASTIKKTKSEPIATRRPSTQLKSPLPGLSQLSSMPPPPPLPKDINMKPAPLPARPAGETLKYASAAAAAAASDKSGMGIAPLPAPSATTAPTASASTTSPAPTMLPLPAPQKPPIPESPAPSASQPAEKAPSPKPSSIAESSQEHSSQSKSPTLSSTSIPIPSVPSSVPPTPAIEKSEAVQEPVIADEAQAANGDLHEEPVEESIYHLPPGLQDLLDSFEVTKRQMSSQTPASLLRSLEFSRNTCPDSADADRPSHYKPNFRFPTPAHYPQEVLPIFDDPAMYEPTRMETDTLFYIFYYRQGTNQQYHAARALKNQSWRFHKQYQTWFQRHEEPKSITEEYEQGTYRFFDYESTW